MTERALGVMFAPCELGTTEQTSKEANVQRVENFIEVVKTAFGPKIALTAAGGANQLRLPRDCGRRGEPLVAYFLGWIELPLVVEFCEEDMRDGTDHGLGCAFKQVGKTNVDMSLSKPNGSVQRGESAEPDRDWRHGRARAQSAIFLLKDGNEFGGHDRLQSSSSQLSILSDQFLTLTAA